MKLYEHQKQGLKAAQDLNHVAFYWDMGLGKTFAGSEKMVQLGENINLVVCQKSKIEDWMDHFEQNYMTDHDVFDLTKPSNYMCFIKTAIEKDVDDTYKIIGIINYDLLWRRPELAKLEDFTLLLDESSLIQNESAKRSKFILKMHPKNVILLSGTPTGGKYEKLWTQMHLLGWNISKDLYWKQFVKVKYLDTVGKSVPLVTGYKNVDRLKRKMAEYGCQFLKTEEFGIDLPDQQDITIRVKASADYKKFMKLRYLQMPDGSEMVGDTSLTSRLYARILCGKYCKEKMAAVKDLIESTEDRLIIFYNFTAEMEALKDLCQSMQRPVSIVNGKTKDLRAYEEDPDSITLIQYQAGAYGLNLQKCCRVIYFTLPESSELFEQSRKRIHRIGQDKKCFYYILMCQGSIEEKIMKALKERKDYTDALFKKDYE